MRAADGGRFQAHATRLASTAACVDRLSAQLPCLPVLLFGFLGIQFQPFTSFKDNAGNRTQSRPVCGQRGRRWEGSVKPLTMLATPDGKWVFPNSAEFFAALGDSDPDYDAIAFAVKNLGFVKLQSIGQSVVEVELHPRNVELPALLAAQQQLLMSQVSVFRIRYFDTAWEAEIWSTAELTIERLFELWAPGYTPA